MIVVFIIGIIFLFTSLICLAIISIKSTSELSKIDGIFIVMIIIGTALITYVTYATDDSPKPIDVYRNKTTLQITYKVQGLDTLSKDTLVVWK